MTENIRQIRIRKYFMSSLSPLRVFVGFFLAFRAWSSHMGIYPGLTPLAAALGG
jgi:hypothetical protein